MILIGRGNVCTHKECEGLYYLDRDLLDVYRCVTSFDWGEEPRTARNLENAGIEYDFDGSHTDWAYDEEASRINWKRMTLYMQEWFTKRYSSFYPEDKWNRSGEVHVILENSFFQIAVIDNEWSAAWCLLERDDIDDSGRARALMRRHYPTHLEAIKTALLEKYGEAVGYGGAWTSGPIYRRH